MPFGGTLSSSGTGYSAPSGQSGEERRKDREDGEKEEKGEREVEKKEEVARDPKSTSGKDRLTSRPGSAFSVSRIPAEAAVSFSAPSLVLSLLLSSVFFLSFDLTLPPLPSLLFPLYQDPSFLFVAVASGESAQELLGGKKPFSPHPRGKRLVLIRCHIRTEVGAQSGRESSVP